MRPLPVLLGASLVSLTGDWIMRTGLAYQVYALTGSTLASAGTVLASLLPQMLLGPLAGACADRWDRRRTMITVNLLLAATLLPLPAVTSPDRVWLVWTVVAVQSCLVPFFVAAEAALLPSLVDPGSLVRANALNTQVRDVARLVGAAAGGVLAGVGGFPLLAAVDAASFLGAAAVLAALPAAARARAATGRPAVTASADRADGVTPGRPWRALAAGLRLIGRAPALRVLAAFFLITGVGEAIMATLMAPFVRDVLDADAAVYGALMSAQAVGGLAGGAAVALIGHRVSPWPAAAWGAVTFGLLDLVLFLYPLVSTALWPAFALLVLAGLPIALVGATTMTIVQTAAAPEHRGRVFGAFLSLEAIAMLAGSLGAGALGDRLGLIPVITVQGAAYCVAGLLLAVAARRARHRAPAPGLVRSP